MDHVCGTLLGAMPMKPAGGRYMCPLLRDEFDTYEYCSHCYWGGEYQYGSAPAEAPLPAGRMFIHGSWDAISTSSEMVGPDDTGAYHYWFRMGETKVEQFRMTMEQNPMYSA